jgi:hypothetical protein
MIHQGDIDLDPEYQRGRCSISYVALTQSPSSLFLTCTSPSAAVVWSSAKQVAIIDSLFHNYYVPPVVFAICKDPVDGYETRLCVDGKQRLTSIQKFFDGQVRPTPHPSPCSISHPYRATPFSLSPAQIACMILKHLCFDWNMRTHTQYTQIAVQRRKRCGGTPPRHPRAHHAPRSPHSKSKYSPKKSSHAVRSLLSMHHPT